MSVLFYSNKRDEVEIVFIFYLHEKNHNNKHLDKPDLPFLLIDIIKSRRCYIFFASANHILFIVVNLGNSE